MAKRNKYRRERLSEFFDYSEGKMSDQERNAFERRMQKDPFASDAAEGFSRVSRGEAEQDLQSAAGRIWDRIEGQSSRNRRNRRIVWYSAAAAFASLMIVTTIFFRLNDNGLERFETAPEMREAAREQSAPLQGGGLEQKEPANEVVMEQEEPLSEGEKEQEKVTGKGTKKQEKEEEHTKKVIAVDEIEETVIKEDHAFAWEKMEEKAAVGRYRATQQQMVSPESTAKSVAAKPKTANNLQSPPEPIISGETPQQRVVVADALQDEAPMEIALMPDEVSLDEVVVIGYGTSKNSQLTASATAKEADPSENLEYESAVPEKGLADFRSYIDTTLVYPEPTETSKKEVVVLKFSIAPDGRPQNYRVIRAPDNKAFENEAIRVVSEGPAWQPATRNGQYSEEEIRLRIVFK